jgi:hypothetical protein
MLALPSRPRQIPIRPPLSEEQINSACYVGSAEHKSKRWWGGLPHGYVNQSGEAIRPKKQQTTICPLITEAERLTATIWIQNALRAGQIKFVQTTGTSSQAKLSTMKVTRIFRRGSGIVTPQQIRFGLAIV